jgi:hypothetical protein
VTSKFYEFEAHPPYYDDYTDGQRRVLFVRNALSQLNRPENDEYQATPKPHQP